MSDPKSNELVEQYLPLALKLAKRMLASAQSSSIDGDEIVSDASYGLLIASRKFDPCYGMSFPAFARTYIWGAMVDGLRRRFPKSQAKVKRVSLDALMVGGEFMLEPLACGDAPVGAALETKEYAQHVARRLNRAEADRIRLREVMEHVKITKPAAWQRIQKARKLAAKMKPDEEGPKP